MKKKTYDADQYQLRQNIIPFLLWSGLIYFLITIF